MSDLDVAHLKALALKATRGEWRNGSDVAHFDSPEVTDNKTFAYYVPDAANATFIAAFSPTTALALVERAEEVEWENERLRSRAETRADESMWCQNHAYVCVDTEQALTEMAAERDALVERDRQFRAACSDMLAKMRSGMTFNTSNCQWCEASWPHPVDATHESIRAQYAIHDEQCTANPWHAKLAEAEAEIERLRSQRNAHLRIAEAAIATEQNERDELRAALIDALAEIDHSWQYAGEYFQEKWRDLEREATWRVLATKEPTK